MPPPVSPFSTSLSRTLTLTLQADYSQLAANPSTLSKFRRDFVNATAAALGLNSSQVQILDGSPRPGSIIVDAVASAAAAAALPLLDTALLQLQASPSRLLGATFLAAYGASSAAVLVAMPPSPPPPSPPPPSPPAPNCAASSLNYTCSLVDGFVTLHWTVGGAAPSNACTATTGTAATASTADSASTLHMAIEAPTSGYVSVGFSSSNKMYPSDVVLGFIASSQGQGTVNTYNLPSGDYYYITSTNFVSPAWTSARGVSQSTSAATGATTTTVCFSRPAAAAAASVSSALDLTGSVNLIWAAAGDGVTDVRVVHDYTGALTLNLGTGAGSDTSYSRKKALTIHGVLMVVAWVVLIPIGTLFARHKWVLGDEQLLGLHTWFQLHRALQIIGTVFVIVGMVYAWVFLKGTPTGGAAGLAHKDMGYAIVACTALQVLLTLVRPKGDAPRRPLWNAVHHNLGRLTILMSWVTIYLGIYIGHLSTAYQLSYSAWFGPVVAVTVVLLAADVALSLLACTRSEQRKRNVLPAPAAAAAAPAGKPAPLAAYPINVLIQPSASSLSALDVEQPRPSQTSKWAPSQVGQYRSPGSQGWPSPTPRKY